ncbi:MAG: hypothetical protein EBV34_02345 [Betaproteobacteria bacterium]|nr:hypothetical protein [Betaproteobacteria bacterium]NDD11311.1 hypothetical protein [Betaproteobacteria bacterium]
MNMGKFRFLWLIMMAIAVSSPAFGAEAIGTVVLVTGSVQRSPAAQQGAAQRQNSDLQRGDVVHEGDVLNTGANAYLYIRTIDQAVLILRPESQLRIEVYRFDPNKAQESRVRLQLEKGHLRSVSGEAAKAHREGWRLNSPIAAIGLRGTDVSVSTDHESTQAVVRAGGIVVAPLGSACKRESFGPCEGATARELAPGLPPMAIWLRRGDPSALVLDLKDVPGAAQLLRLPADERVGLERKADIAATSNQGLFAKPGSSPSSMMVNWGRWQSFSGAPIGSADRPQAFVAYNGYYGLTRDVADQSLPPSRGVFSFRLLGHEGYFIDNLTQRSYASTASQASLRIDMDAGRFTTRMLLASGDISAWLEGKGSLSQLGLLLAQPGADSNALIQGTLANSGSQAAYIYVRVVDGQGRFVGASSWRK